MVWLGFTTSCRRTFERNLRSLVSARPFRWCFTRFHQDLGWLSCLRSSTFRHAVDHYVIRVSPDISASFWSSLISLSSVPPFFISDARSCYRYLEPNDCSAPILLLLLVHRRWLDSGMVFSSLTHSIAEANLFLNLFDEFVFLWSGHWNWMFLSFLTILDCPFRVGSADWRANGPP